MAGATCSLGRAASGTLFGVLSSGRGFCEYDFVAREWIHLL
jgi:hypothetical protein